MPVIDSFFYDQKKNRENLIKLQYLKRILINNHCHNHHLTFSPIKVTKSSVKLALSNEISEQNVLECSVSKLCLIDVIKNRNKNLDGIQVAVKIDKNQTVKRLRTNVI